MEHQNVTLRMPVSLIAKIDAAVKAEAEATGLRVDRSSLIRKVLHLALRDVKSTTKRALEK